MTPLTVGRSSSLNWCNQSNPHSHILRPSDLTILHWDFFFSQLILHCIKLTIKTVMLKRRRKGWNFYHLKLWQMGRFHYDAVVFWNLFIYLNASVSSACLLIFPTDYWLHKGLGGAPSWMLGALGGGKGREKCCNHLIISKVKLISKTNVGKSEFRSPLCYTLMSVCTAVCKL